MFAITGLFKQAADRTFKDRLLSAVKVVAKPVSEAQREAGNYRQGHARMHGLNITIQFKRGQKRKPEWPPLLAHYGHIVGVPAKSRDGEHVDVFVGTQPDSEVVFVADIKQQGSGDFDEPKVFVGWTSKAEARRVLDATYPAEILGGFYAITAPQLREWLHHGTATKPIGNQIASLKSAKDGDKPSSVLLVVKDRKIATVDPETDLDLIRKRCR